MRLMFPKATHFPFKLKFDLFPPTLRKQVDNRAETEQLKVVPFRMKLDLGASDVRPKMNSEMQKFFFLPQNNEDYLDFLSSIVSLARKGAHAQFRTRLSLR